MKKLVIFASFGPSLLNFRRQLIEAFLGLGLEVVALAPSNTIDQDFKSKFISLLPKVRLEGVEMNAYSLNPLDDIKALFELIKFFKKEKPDLLFSYTIKPVIYGSLAAKVAGVPHVFSMITGLGSMFMVHRFTQKILLLGVKLLYRLGLRMNEKVFFQNADDAQLFEKMRFVCPEQALLVNGSGVDLQHYYLEKLPTQISFLFIGRLLVDKGVGEYIEAAKVIKQSYPHTEFKLLGAFPSGHPRAYDDSLLKLAIQDKVIVYHTEVEDIRPFMRGASVFVLPSYREGMPRSVLEAMSMGRPIITTDAPGCRETVERGGNGYLVPVKDVNGLANAMMQFIEHPKLIKEMGLKSRALAESKYDVHQVNKTILLAMKLI